MKPNEIVTTFFVLHALERRESKTGQRCFLSLKLSDRSGSITGYVWNEIEQVFPAIKRKPFVKVRGITRVSNDMLVIHIEKIRGAMLYGIGKTKEIQWETIKRLSTEGILLGHINIRLIMLANKISIIKGFPKEYTLRLKHMLLSYHGTLEYGNPIIPAAPEAIVLHLIENPDAKIIISIVILEIPILKPYGAISTSFLRPEFIKEVI